MSRRRIFSRGRCISSCGRRTSELPRKDLSRARMACFRGFLQKGFRQIPFLLLLQIIAADIIAGLRIAPGGQPVKREKRFLPIASLKQLPPLRKNLLFQIGRASCRERV